MNPEEFIPKFYKRLFKTLCRDELYHELAGDLEESFAENIEALGTKKSRSIYKKEVLQLIRPSVLPKFKMLPTFTPLDMIKNYLKISLRNIWRDKEHSLISLLGLSAGIVVSVLIFQYANFESSYDSLHDQTDGKIYRMSRITSHIASGEITAKNANTFHGFHPAVGNDLPEIVSSTKVFTISGVFTSEERGHNVPDAFFTTSSFFDVFSFPLIRGNKVDLDQPGTVFISESLATRIFKNDDPMEKLMRYNDINSNLEIEVVVKGVFKDFPANSHLQMSAMLAMPDLNAHADANWFGSFGLNDVTWRWVNFHTYIKARPDVKMADLSGKLTGFIRQYRAPFDQTQGREQTVIAHPLEELHFIEGFTGQLTPSGDKSIVLLFKLIGLLIVVIAWINFVNLASAKAVLRAREVGVRKALGAYKKQLIQQFLLETLLINMLALILSIGIILLIIPTFHNLVGAPVFDLFPDFKSFWSLYAAVFLIGSMVSGIYPALVLTRFQPIKVLRGNFSHSGQGIWLRKGLTLIQFSVVLILLSGILAIRSQIQYMIHYDTGMNIQQTLVIDAPPTFLRDSLYEQKIESYRDAIQSIPSVNTTTLSSAVPGLRNGFGQTIYRNDRPSNESIFLFRSFIDPFFLSFFDLELLEGRDFDQSLEGDGNVILINEKALAQFNFESPKDAIGKRLVYPTGQTPLIVGVVKNFNLMGMKFPVDPFALELDTAHTGAFMNIRINTQNVNETVSRLEEAYAAMFPQAPFNAFFLDQTFNDLYESDQKFSSVLQFFAIIAIFISSLGIFGLSSFLINQKLKEIGIRKVLGAGLSEIIRVLTKEYIWLITLSTLIAVPLAYFLVKRWLDGFIIRMNIEALIFIIPVVGLALIVLTTIGHKIWRAARSNPVRVLKNE